MTPSDPDFRHAVALADAGDLPALRRWIEGHPTLLHATAEGEGFETGYFAHARLLWFVAENPIRNGTMPANVAEVADTLIQLSRQQGVPDIEAQVEYTLGLVMSGRIARDCGAQRPLGEVLVRAGADPATAMRTALAHRELDAGRALLELGAPMTLLAAAGLGLADEVRRLIAGLARRSLKRALQGRARMFEAGQRRAVLDLDTQVLQNAGQQTLGPALRQRQHERIVGLQAREVQTRDPSAREVQVCTGDPGAFRQQGRACTALRQDRERLGIDADGARLAGEVLRLVDDPYRETAAG